MGSATAARSSTPRCPAHTLEARTPVSYTHLEVATSGQEEALFLTVLSVDGEVTSATASGAAGVTIAAASGDFTVTFSEEGVGATVESAGGTTTFTAAVEQLPLLAE